MTKGFASDSFRALSTDPFYAFLLYLIGGTALGVLAATLAASGFETAVVYWSIGVLALPVHFAIYGMKTSVSRLVLSLLRTDRNKQVAGSAVGSQRCQARDRAQVVLDDSLDVAVAAVVAVLGMTVAVLLALMPSQLLVRSFWVADMGLALSIGVLLPRFVRGNEKLFIGAAALALGIVLWLPIGSLRDSWVAATCVAASAGLILPWVIRAVFLNHSNRIGRLPESHH